MKLRARVFRLTRSRDRPPILAYPYIVKARMLWMPSLYDSNMAKWSPDPIAWRKLPGEEHVYRQPAATTALKRVKARVRREHTRALSRPDSAISKYPMRAIIIKLCTAIAIRESLIEKPQRRSRWSRESCCHWSHETERCSSY